MNLQARISTVDAVSVLAVTVQAGVALWLWGQFSHLIPLDVGGRRVIWRAAGSAAWNVGFGALLSALALGVVMTVERREAMSPAFGVVATMVKWSLTLIPMAQAIALFAAAVSA